MSSTEDPPRLLDPRADAPAFVSSALEAARGEAPDAARLKRIAGHFSGTGSGSSGAIPPKASAAPSTLSGGLVGALAGLVVGAGILLHARFSESPPEPRTVQAPAIAMTEKTPSVPLPSASSEATPVSEAVTSSGPVERAAKGTIPTKPSPSTAEGESAEVPAIESEASILSRAQKALGTNPAQALAITEEHRTRHPSGFLAQEREVLAISALLALGKRVEARARGERFLETHPNTAHAGRIHVLLPELKSYEGVHKEPEAAPRTP